MHPDLQDCRRDEPSPVTNATISRGLHDLAQPLTMLMGLLELALSRPETESELRMTVELSLDQAGRAVALLNQVRELVREKPTAQNVGIFPEEAGNPGSGKVQACQAR